MGRKKVKSSVAKLLATADGRARRSKLRIPELDVVDEAVSAGVMRFVTTGKRASADLDIVLGFAIDHLVLRGYDFEGSKRRLLRRLSDRRKYRIRPEISSHLPKTS
jgi:hypothetical protein